MKQHRRFESWQRDANRCLEHPDRVGIDDLIRMGHGFYRIEDQVIHNTKRLHLLPATLKKLRESNGPGRTVFEERVMERLTYLAHVESGKSHASKP